MSEDYSVGDVIRLNNTQQEGEVLELITVVDDSHHGPLLRVNLLDVNPAMIVYYPVRSVSLVRKAEADESKKASRSKKAEHDHGKKADHGGKKLLT